MQGGRVPHIPIWEDNLRQKMAASTQYYIDVLKKRTGQHASEGRKTEIEREKSDKRTYCKIKIQCDICKLHTVCTIVVRSAYLY